MCVEVIVFNGVLCTNVAVSVLRILFSVMLLKLGPEDVPGSPRLLQQIIIVNLISAIVALSARYDASTILYSSVLDLVLLLGFCYLLLLALNRLPRFIQTATALCGVGIFFHLLLWPLLLPATGEGADESLQTLIGVLMLLLISWELLVIAHIFRRAIESSMTSAIALSFALFIISITVSQLLFPGAQ